MYTYDPRTEYVDFYGVHPLDVPLQEEPKEKHDRIYAAIIAAQDLKKISLE